MLVFIDESGDPGFKLTQGSSPLFVVSLVIFRSGDDARHAQSAIEVVSARNNIRKEWKFSNCSNAMKSEFFNGRRGLNFQVRSIVVDKSRIYSDNLKSNKESFYKFFVRKVLQNDNGVLQEAKIVIDGSGDRTFKKQFAAYLRKHLPKGAMKNLRFKDSKKDPLIQLADMTAGAVARAHHPSSRANAQWINMLRENDQVDDIWFFK